MAAGPIIRVSSATSSSGRSSGDPCVIDDVILLPLDAERRLAAYCRHTDDTVDHHGNDDVTTSDSDFYDTDIESEIKPSTPRRGGRYSPEHESIDTYRSTCEQNCVAPQVAIVRSLPEAEVNVRHRCLGDGDTHALSAALSRNSSVTRLQLAGNNIGSLGAMYLKTVLTLNQNITYLDLSDNDLGREPASSSAIADVLRFNSSLETLILAGNNLRDQDAIYLSAGIMANSHLENLDLSRNLIGEVGGVHLGRAFAVNNSVDMLNLSWNSIRQRGAVAICKGLQDNGYVSKLDVSWNGFGYEGALAVGELLKRNSTLTQLDLSSNRITWKAVQFIVEGLAKNNSLEVLRLDQNPLTTTGCMDLIDAVADHPNSAIVNLGLKGVPVLGDFELTVMLIRQRQPEFVCQHGGIVNSSDIIGQRLERRVTPIEKVIQFMKEREYRTSELFRILDKDGASNLTHEELGRRMLRIGVRLHAHEIEELMDFIQDMGSKDSSFVNFQKMTRGVKGHQNRERQEKIRERRRDAKLRQYHQTILTGSDDRSVTTTTDQLLPPINPDVDSEDEKKALLATLRNGARTSQTNGTQTTVANGAKSGNVMSMSVALGSKAVPFGKAVDRKKKKSTKKKSSKKKGKTIDTRNYDDEGVMQD